MNFSWRSSSDGINIVWDFHLGALHDLNAILSLSIEMTSCDLLHGNSIMNPEFIHKRVMGSRGDLLFLILHEKENQQDIPLKFKTILI